MHSARLFLLGSLLVATLLANAPQSISAHTPAVALASYGSAVIDGIKTPGEWDRAAQVDFAVDLPGGGTRPATLLSMNDDNNLYLAVLVSGPVIGRGTITFEFDNDHDGIREQGDNAVLVNVSSEGTFEVSFDIFRDLCGFSTPACGFFDNGIDANIGRPFGGTIDMVGAVAHDSAGTFFEFSLTLDSADDAHDFSLGVGDTVGFTLVAQFLGPFPLFSRTFYPGHIAFPAEWGDIAIVSSDWTPPDTTPPVVTALIPTPNAQGWYDRAVTVDWSVADPESGITSTAGCESRTLTEPTAGTTVTCTATNGAGLTTTQSVVIRIDTVAPTIVFGGNAGSYGVDDTIVITCTAADDLSGIASVSCPGVAGPATDYVGTSRITTTTLTATAVDLAGNSVTASTSFIVTVSAAGICQLSADLTTASDICAHVTSIAAAPNDAAREGKLGAFDRFLAAERDKSIPVNMTVLLSRLAHLL